MSVFAPTNWRWWWRRFDRILFVLCQSDGTHCNEDSIKIEKNEMKATVMCVRHTYFNSKILLLKKSGEWEFGTEVKKTMNWILTYSIKRFLFSLLSYFYAAIQFVTLFSLYSTFFILFFFVGVDDLWQQCTKCDKLSTYGPNDGFINFERVSAVHIHQNNNDSSTDPQQQWHELIQTARQING